MKSNNVSLVGDTTKLSFNKQCKTTILTKQGKFVLISIATNTMDVQTIILSTLIIYTYTLHHTQMSK